MYTEVCLLIDSDSVVLTTKLTITFCVCVCVCMCVYLYVYISVGLCVCMFMHVHLCAYLCVSVSGGGADQVYASLIQAGVTSHEGTSTEKRHP